jgi:HAD superfamily hydrolase (TIGR01509 family)
VERGRGQGTVVRAVVWDMDGTLIDSAAVVPDAYITAVSRRGGRRYSRGEIIAAYRYGPPSPMLTELLGRACTSEDVEEYHACLRATAAAALPYPGIVDILDALRQRRMPLAVFTGAHHDGACILLEASGLLPYFARVVGGDEVEHQKPAPDGVLAACAALGVEPVAAAYVGDAPSDLTAARASGALAVAAGWGHFFHAAAPADLVVATPQELLTALGVAGGGASAARQA